MTFQELKRHVEEAPEDEIVLGQKPLDLRQGEGPLVDVQEEVAKAARRAEVHASPELGARRVLGQSQQVLAVTAQGLGIAAGAGIGGIGLQNGEVAPRAGAVEANQDQTAGG